MTIPSLAASGIPAAAVLIALTCTALAATRPVLHAQTLPPQIRVFLDCGDCFPDFLRTEVTFVDYVRDRSEADVHVLITSTETGGGGREYTAAFIGAGSYQGIDHTLKAVTTQSDQEDVVRRQLATTLRIGLLNYVARGGVPQRLGVTVRLGSEDERPAVAGDRWNNWVFSLQGSASFEGEESSRESQLGASVGADRITPDWKITLGAELDHETEEFDLDEEEPVKVKRQEREFRTLTVKSLGEHWSAGFGTELGSSTFNNMQFYIEAAPAVEFNVFPYSQYTRRQLRVLYLARRAARALLRGNAVRQTRGNAAPARAQRHLRATGAVGLAAGQPGRLAVSARPQQVPSRSGRRGVVARGSGPVRLRRGQRLPHPRSALAAPPRRDAGRDFPAAATSSKAGTSTSSSSA